MATHSGQKRSRNNISSFTTGPISMLCSAGSIVVFSGSLPPGMTVEGFRAMIDVARAEGAKISWLNREEAKVIPLEARNCTWPGDRVCTFVVATI